jgi:phosphohistidine phosphatase SixA
MLLVVRHAEAGDKSTWKGPDALRPLSPSGHL